MQCLQLSGNYIRVTNVTVNGCNSHGVLITGKHIIFENSTVTNTVRENVDRSGGWGSGVKVQIGGENVTIRNNHVYENHGEGIAATRGRNVLIEGNLIHDNYSVNLYIDNSPNTTARGNRVTNTGVTSFYRNGNPAQCILLGTENYAGWGNQFRDVLVEGNWIYNCYRGIRFYGENGMTIPQGSNVRVLNNYFHNTTMPWISLPSSVLVNGNVAGTPPPDGQVPATATPAPATVTRTPTATRTPSVTLPPSMTVTRTPTRTPTGTQTITETPTFTVAPPLCYPVLVGGQYIGEFCP
jgi:parallel beta-helix repeat protein